MTSMDTTTIKPPFGVGERIGETFSILRQRFLTFVVLAAIPGILSQLITLAAGLGGRRVFEPELAAGNAASLSPLTLILVVGVVPIVIYSVMTGMMIMAAYDTKSGRPVRYGAYFKTTAKRLAYLIIVTIVATFGISIGAAIFLVPGLWLAGVWAVCVPVVMIEGLGLGAFGRSRELTKEYRWPIVGFLVVTYIIFSVISFLVAIAAAVLPFPAIMVAIVLGLINGITTALLSIAVSVTYARLRDIKEGAGYADLAEVFD